MNNELNIGWCYPDILNLHGDRGNIMAIKKVAELLNLKVNITKIETLDQKIDFDNTDILFFNPGELKSVQTIVEGLEKQKDKLDEYIGKNKVIIAIGTTGAVFSKKVTRTDESTISGLGYLDMECIEKTMVYGDDIIYNLAEDENMQIVGSQIQLIDINLKSDIALGKLEYGRGNNGDSKKEEGAKYKNLIFTNALGPIFVKNPWFAKKIITDVMKIKGTTIEDIDEDKVFELEKKSMESIKEFHNKYKN